MSRSSGKTGAVRVQLPSILLRLAVVGVPEAQHLGLTRRSPLRKAVCK
jgi:hypothetical protein